MSLRENSELSIEEYRFGGRADGLEKAFYKLLKGGLRTVTGLIGHTRHENYRIDSVTATIGIRGIVFQSRSRASRKRRLRQLSKIQVDGLTAPGLQLEPRRRSRESLKP